MNTTTSEHFAAQLSIGTIQVLLTPDLLKSVVNGLEDSELSQAVFAELARHPSFEVRETVASKEHLDRDTALRLAADPCVEVVRSLLHSSACTHYVNRETLQAMVERDPAIAYDLAESWRVDEFSEVDVDEMFELLLGVADESVRFALAGNSHVGKKSLRKLSKDANPAVAQRARRALENM